MKDVGDIDKRVQQLEYYTTLSALEAQTSQQTVLYADQSGQKPCYGIVVDNFSTFDVADNNNVDLICNISQNALSPYKSVNYFNLKLYGTTDQVSVNLTTGKQNKTTHTLAYTETPCVVQNTATTTTGVQPYLFGKFEGTVALTPSVDNWFSKVLRPYVILPNGVFFYPPPLNGPFGIVLGPWVWNYWNSSLYYYNGYYLGEYGLDWVGYGTIDPIAYNYIYRYNNGSSLTVGNGSSQNDVRFIPAGAAGSGVIFNRVVNK